MHIRVKPKEYNTMANINNMTIAETLIGNNLVTTSKSFFGLISKSVYRPTGSRLTALKKEYDPLNGNKIEYALNSDTCKRAQSIASLGHIADSPIGNCLLEACYSADHKFAAVRLLQFSQLKYQPVTDTCVFENDEAESVISSLLL